MGVFARGQRLNHGRALLPKAPVRIDAATQIRAEQAAKKRKDDADLEVRKSKSGTSSKTFCAYTFRFLGSERDHIRCRGSEAQKRWLGQ